MLKGTPLAAKRGAQFVFKGNSANFIFVKNTGLSCTEKTKGRSIHFMFERCNLEAKIRSVGIDSA